MPFGDGAPQNYKIDLVADVIEENANLSIIQEQEKLNLDIMANYYAEDSAALTKARRTSGNNKTAERYLTLKDIDDNEEYLYAEYIGGGYAIYDRLGEYLYERSQNGSGPFDSYDGGNLYYGGPSQFYVTREGAYEHTVTGEVVTTEELDSNSEGLEYVRQEYAGGNKNEMSLNQMATRAAVETYVLGENIPESDPTQTDAMWYFAARAYSYGRDYSTGKVTVWNNEYFNFSDLYMGQNRHGSCTFVALSTVMMFYDRIGKVDMVPNDVSSFNLIENYWASYSSTLANGYIYNTNKNLIKTEALHQYLLYLTFPGKRGQTNYGSSEFSYSIENLGGVYNSYAANQGLPSRGYQSRNGINLLPEQILKGNPVIVSLSAGYRTQHH